MSEDKCVNVVGLWSTECLGCTTSSTYRDSWLRRHLPWSYYESLVPLFWRAALKQNVKCERVGVVFFWIELCHALGTEFRCKSRIPVSGWRRECPVKRKINSGLNVFSVLRHSWTERDKDREKSKKAQQGQQCIWGVTFFFFFLFE